MRRGMMTRMAMGGGGMGPGMGMGGRGMGGHMGGAGPAGHEPAGSSGHTH